MKAWTKCTSEDLEPVIFICSFCEENEVSKEDELCSECCKGFADRADLVAHINSCDW